MTREGMITREGRISKLELVDVFSGFYSGIYFCFCETEKVHGAGYSMVQNWPMGLGCYFSVVDVL